MSRRDPELEHFLAIIYHRRVANQEDIFLPCPELFFSLRIVPAFSLLFLHLVSSCTVFGLYFTRATGTQCLVLWLFAACTMSLFSN